jgi:effector-binding domain-containing protein
MSYNIEQKTIKPQPMVSVRSSCRVAEIGPVLKEMLPEVFTFLDERGIRPSGPPFTRYHSFDGTNCEIEAGFPVAEPQEGTGRVEPGELPGGAVISTIHTGPYEDLPKAHDALDLWIQEHGKKSRGPQWESYVSDPAAEPDPHKRETELIWPIR